MGYLQVHLLLADDDSDDRAFFCEAIQKVPINVELSVVKDGEELMQWLLKTPDSLPDLLFLDINMPRKNGHECLKEIKQHPTLKSLPVIILSTAANPREIELLYTNGAQYYVQKPNEFSQLVHVIEDVLKMDKEKQRVQPAKENFVFQHH
jgi:CheY-like chemotaxis protein